MNLYLLKYNNYYNRILKRKNSIYEYQDYILDDPIMNVNFNPNDGVTTKQVVNIDIDIPDYLVAVTPEGSINSRWFVIESRRLLSGQFELVLYRDLLADYYEDILTAPVYIEKAILNQEDPFIYNSENMSFNQIKKNEYLLKDGSGVAWLVGYTARPEEGEESKAIDVGSIDINYTLTASSIENWEYKRYIQQPFLLYNNYQCVLNVTETSAQPPRRTKYIFNDNGPIKYEKTDEFYLGLEKGTLFSRYYTDQSFLDILYENRPNNLTSLAISYSGIISTDENTHESLRALQNQIIRVGTQEPYSFYYIRINEKQYSFEENINIESNIGVALKETINNIPYKSNIFAGSIDSNDFNLIYQTSSLILELTEITVETGAKITYSKDRRILTDAPYCMFAIPYGKFTYQLNNVRYETSSIAGMDMAISIAKELGIGSSGQAIYDLQLLPYCPIPQFRGKRFNIDGMRPGIDYNIPTGGVKSILFWCSESNGSFLINFPYTVQDYKIENECDMWRLCSPNYNGVFEFSMAKNKGCKWIDVDYTYKPYTPYIHLNPNFGGLYGQDYNDSRGLICGGDFSVSLISDAFTNYELANKNYQQIFDRQIQNLEITQDVQREREIWSAITGALGQTVSGGVTGAIMSGGNPIAAAAGAIGYGGVSLAAGIRDIALGDILRNEALDYTKDQFGYQLDNIRALPNNLAKTSALTYNNKIWPFIEYYTCSDEEKEALINKIKYNGMTVMRIGIISDYINRKYKDAEYTYIKAKLIRLESIIDDYHIVNVIASELNKGVYI